jgi:predicted flap endonuclease-1-like 5' DNA nuclease
MGRIRDLHCLRTNEANQLVDFGVTSTDRLLLVASKRQGREDLAEETGISESKILRLVQLADLMRVKGIGSEYTRLLDRVGVQTLKQLGRRSPQRLMDDFANLNSERQVVQRMPSIGDVRDWVEGAKRMASLVSG